MLWRSWLCVGAAVGLSPTQRRRVVAAASKGDVEDVARDAFRQSSEAAAFVFRLSKMPATEASVDLLTAELGGGAVQDWAVSQRRYWLLVRL